MEKTPAPAADAILVFTTAGSEEQARGIAEALVERRLAACVNLLPGIRSIYRWKGKLWDDEEILLIIKTVSGRFQEVAETIRECHSYELPEVLAVPVGQGDAKVLAWLAASVTPSPGEDR